MRAFDNPTIARSLARSFSILESLLCTPAISSWQNYQPTLQAPNASQASPGRCADIQGTQYHPILHPLMTSSSHTRSEADMEGVSSYISSPSSSEYSALPEVPPHISMFLSLLLFTIMCCRTLVRNSTDHFKTSFFRTFVPTGL